MFGRLGMSVDEAKEHCSAIVNDVFSEKKRIGGESFKATKLEAAVKRMLASYGAGENARMIAAQAESPGGCKVYAV
jgi:hypothetical protein